MKTSYEGFNITDEETTVQRVYELLSNENSLADTSISAVEKAINNSLCVSAYDGLNLIGFARVITDYSALSIILDVVIDPNYRSKGLGRGLFDFIHNHPKLRHTAKILWTKGGEKFFNAMGYKTLDRTLLIKR
jgi:N-acetylglutamate synthase-like GNAT family acetyltransferase